MSFRQEIRNPAAAAGLLLLAAACAGPGAEPETPETPEVQEPEVQAPVAPPLAELAAQAEADPNAALNALDRWSEHYAEDVDYWRLYAQATQALFDANVAAGRMTDGLATDLAGDLERAWAEVHRLAPEDPDALLGLADARFLQGSAEGAWDAAAQVFPLLGEDELHEARVAAARYGVRAVAEAVSAGRPVPAAARLAEAELVVARDAGARSATVPLSDLYAWQGQTEDAVEVLLGGLVEDPTDEQLYQRLANLTSADLNLQVATLEKLRGERPDSAMALWFCGDARFRAGRTARAGADYLKAMECWDRAEECFLQAMTLEPAYGDTCREFLHLIRTQRGWTLRDEGRPAEAAATLLAALEADPERLEAEAGPDTLRLGLDAAVADLYRGGKLKDARGALRRMLAVDPSSSDWANNLGFFCRDLGIEAQQNNNQERADQLFQESWEAYSLAADLAPDDARIVNDRALISVYYLDEHWDFAEQELHRSIDLGSAQLAEMGEDVPAGERQDLEEAVGDAWENLAYLSLVRRGEIGEAPRYLDESVKYFPYENRGGVRRLRATLAELKKED